MGDGRREGLGVKGEGQDLGTPDLSIHLPISGVTPWEHSVA